MHENIIIILSIICLLSIMFNYFGTTTEPYTGALIQLAAKGPQDTYLTDDAWKYLYPYYYSPYYPWYIPTRRSENW